MEETSGATSYRTKFDGLGEEWRENEGGQFEKYPFASVPWDVEPDGSAAFEKMPDRYSHL